MKLKKCAQKFSFIFVMLVITLTLFCIFLTPKLVNAENDNLKINSLIIDGYENYLEPSFDADIFEYDLLLDEGEYDLKIIPTLLDSSSNYEIIGNIFLKNNNGVIKIVITNTDNEKKEYIFNYSKEDLSTYTYSFDFIESESKFLIPSTGTYKLEAWGASGGGVNDYAKAGPGGYSRGYYNFKKNDEVFVNVGGKGKLITSGTGGSGYNGGGAAQVGTYNKSAGGGGGATHIALLSGELKSLSSNKSSVLLVAGGGGGAGWYYTDDTHNFTGGAGGGLSGTNGAGTSGNPYGTGGSQTAAGYASGKQSQTQGTFGQGGTGLKSSSSAGGGGGGFFGGGGSYCAGGGGGSGFIANTISYNSDSPITIDGTKELPTYDNLSTMVGNYSDGYAKITMAYPMSDNNYIKELKYSSGTINPSFDPTINNYTITVDPFTQYIDIDAVLYSNESSLIGNDNYKLNVGDNNITLTVTAENGELKIYTLNIYRQEFNSDSHTSKVNYFEIKKYDNIIVNNDKYEYQIKIDPNETDLDITPMTYDSEATYIIKNNKLLLENEGIITITVSEPNSEDSIYKIKYIRKEPYEYNYSFEEKGEMIFEAPFNGYYKLETWGASGGGVNDYAKAGAGGYSRGYTVLNAGDKLYVNIGGEGFKVTSGTGGAGYNGGGNAQIGSYNKPSAGGGGATHIALESGILKSFNNNVEKLLIVSGGGGGAGWYYTDDTHNFTGGAGGGLSGQNGYGVSGNPYGSGATQTAAGFASGEESSTRGSFGQGGNGLKSSSSAGGGGGGFYGGGGSYCAGGGGGSGYIDNLLSYNNDDPITIQGTSEMPNHDGTENMIGNYGDGFAKITLAYPFSTNNFIKELKYSTGVIDKEFNPTINEYTIEVDMYTSTIDLEAILYDEKATISGDGKHIVDMGTNKFDLVVTSENGDIRTYTVNVVRKFNDIHTSELQKISIEGYDDIYMKKNVFEYEMNIDSSEVELFVKAFPYDPEATAIITGNKKILNDVAYMTIVVNEPNTESLTYRFKINKEDISGISNIYNYLGEEEIVKINTTGIYKLEVWGASGGDASTISFGGKGGYSKGYIELNANTLLYLNVGGQGQKEIEGTGGAGYNGGADANLGTSKYPSGGGGGATSISLSSGKINEFENKKEDLLIVAGGGGGAGYYYNTANGANNSGGAGGGLTGIRGTTSQSGNIPGNGGSQTTAGAASGYESKTKGSFGQGGNGLGDTSSAGGGGGGFFGGGGGFASSGGGGSSYIENLESYNNDNPITIAGNASMPSCNINENIIGNLGDGCARITLVHSYSKDNYLNQIIVTNPKTTNEYKITPAFDPTIEEYNIKLGIDDTEIKIEARPSSDLSIIEGLGKKKVIAGSTTYAIMVTAESGDIRTYNVTVEREASTESTAKNIEITGLVESVCGGKAGYCKLDTEFEENKNTYYMTVPAGIRELEFTVDKKNYYQEVIGDGVVKLNGGENIITIEITSEDGKNRTVYTYEIERDMTEDNYLDKLEVVNPSIDIGFQYLITEYNIKVENEVTSLELEIKTDDEKATYRVIGNENFSVGNNIVEIEVAAANGETRNYVLNVYRLPNSNPLLKTLEVKNGEISYTLSPEFEDIKTNYVLNVENEVEEIEVIGEAAAETTEVSGTGIYELKTGINSIKVITTSESGDIETYTIIVTREKNSNNYLRSLSVLEGTLNETFEKEKIEYTITVNPYIKNLTIEAEAEVSTSKVSIIGNGNFKIGENKVIVKVTAENGETREYIIIVTKEGSENNYLSTLKVNQGELSPEYNKEILEYNVEVENEIGSITVTGEREDVLSKVSGLGTYKLATGNNKIKVIVTSETGIIREYIINVFRKYNDNANLKGIELSKGELSPEFNKEITEYVVNVENEVEEITVTGIKEVGTTVVEENGRYQLSTGLNEIILKATSESGIEKEYKITVIRDISNNANLKYLIVKNGIMNPAFDKMILEYTVKVPNEEEMAYIEAGAENENSTVTINSQKLEVGENEISIIVTAEDGSIKTYKLTVIRQEKVEKNLNLKTLDVTSCTLNPEFEGNTQYYECEVEYEIKEVIVNASLEDETNSLTGTGRKTLEVGKNVIGIKVEDEEMHEKGYQVVVTRKESTESRLKNILVEFHQLNETFDKDIYEYSINTEEESLKFNIEKMHEKQSIEIIGNEKFTLGENVVQIKVRSADLSNESIYVIKVNKMKSSNNYLKSLEVEGYEISPVFEKGITEYRLTVPNEENSVIVSAEAEKETTVISGIGMHSLQVGENKIQVEATSESGEIREYEITVTREGSNNNYLKTLGIKNHELEEEFSKEKNEYNITLEYEENKIEIEAESEDESATVEGIGEIELTKKGINIIPITVTSESGKINVYYIKVTRLDPVSSLLEELKIKNYELDSIFESEKYEYIVVVDNEVESLEIEAVPLDPKATVIIEGNENFEVGINEVKIKVTSSDLKETSTYILTVNRQAYSNTYLNSISVEGETKEYELNPEFSKTTLSYEVVVPYEEERVNISASAENITSKVSGIGLKELEVGENISKITVTSTGGIVRNYIINIKRTGSSEAGIERITSTLGKIEKLDETNYKLTVPKGTEKVTKENIEVETKDIYAKVEKMEELIIVSGEENIYVVTVISADNSVTKEYLIYVEYEKSSDARLKSLSASAGNLTPTFSKDIYEYKLDVLDTESEIEFSVLLNDESSILLTSNLVFSLNEYSTKASIIVQAEDGSIKEYIITIEKSITTEKYLQNIKVTGYEEVCESCEVTPEYSETEYNYKLTVPYEVENIEFNITKKHQNQEVKIYKEEIEVIENTLDVGINNYEVRVENSIGEQTIYYYEIERLKSTNNYLKSLKLTSPDIVIEDFDREKLEYNVRVPYIYENIEIEATPEDETNAKVTIKGTTYLIEGNNDVSIKVKAASGEVREYIMHVLRTPENNNLLKTLTVSSGDIYKLSPKFEPGIMEYSLTVASAVEGVMVEGLADSESATVEGNGEYRLLVGLNKIELKVASENGSIRKYTILITREADKNAYLSKLEVKNGEISPTFEKTVGIYIVNVDHTVESLELIVEAEVEGSTVEIIENEGFITGKNVVKIKVTSRDKTAVKTYVLNVIKEGNVDNDLLGIQVDNEEIEGFEKDILEYNVRVENERETVSITVTKSDEKQTIRREGLYSLEEGNNKIEIEVEAENGSRKTYILNIYREKNNYLSMLVTDRGEVNPEFNKEILEYNLEVENKIEDITVIGIKESTKSNVIGNGRYELEVGENKIEIKVVNEDNEERIYTITVTREGSNNNYLRYLEVAEGKLSPEFSKEIQEYEVHIPDDKTNLTLDYLVDDESSVAEEIGNENFDEREEEVIIRVTSTNKETREYKIRVIREDASLFSNKLKDLSVNKGTMSPAFDPDISSYAVTVTNDIEEIKISAVRESIDSVVTGTGTYKLNIGRNVFRVTVTSKDGKDRVYTLIIYRNENPDTRLKTLSFNEGVLSPVFNKNVYDYVMNIENGTEMLSIKEIAAIEESSKIKIDGLLLDTENKIVTITVTSKDKSKQSIYKVKVETVASSNAYLKELKVSGYEITPVFDKNTNIYKVTVGSNVNSVNVTGETENSRAIVEGFNIYTVKTGKNYINITVTAENGIINVYTVVVEKEASTNNYLRNLFVRGYKIIPEFDKEILEYKLEVENEEEIIEIVAEKEEEEEEIIGLGEKRLQVGENNFEVSVISESGDIRIYKINIIRKRKISSKLEYLEVLEGSISPEFNKDTLEYYVTVPNEYEEVSLKYKTEETEASVIVEGNENLQVGQNKIEIRVISTSGEESIYVVNVTKSKLTNNYLSSLTVDKGELSPEFNRSIQNYEVRVGNEVEKITVGATSEANTSTVSGIGEYELQTGENKIIVKVVSESFVIREYKITVIREKSTNNNLRDIIVSEGNLSPSFNKDILNYEVTVEEGTKEIEITGIVEDERATVEGNGIYEVKVGENEIPIMVTSENGEIKEYKVIVKREKSSNTNIINMIPSTGELSPEFDNNVDNYEIIIDKNINILDIEVETESKEAIVTGNKGLIVNKDITYIIEIEAEDGSKREITINVIKEKAVEKIEAVKKEINVVEGEEEKIEVKVYPEDAIVNLKYEVEYEEKISVTEEGVITGKKEGETKVKIKVEENNLLEEEIIVRVYSKDIRSEEYSVIEKEEGKIIIGMEEGETIKELIEKLENPEELIKIYDKEGNSITDLNEIVKTGLVVKLEINNKVYDEAIVIVRGDINEDGVIDVSDKVKLVNHILLKEELTDYRIYACDLVVDDIVDVSDKVKLVNYILKKIDSLN